MMPTRPVQLLPDRAPESKQNELKTAGHGLAQKPATGEHTQQCVPLSN